MLAYIAVLWPSRRDLLQRKSTRLVRATGFLHREYKPHLFWWELVEMIKRLLLVGVMVLDQGSMVQLTTGTFLSAAFLLVQYSMLSEAGAAADALPTASMKRVCALAALCWLVGAAPTFFALRGVAGVHGNLGRRVSMCRHNVGIVRVAAASIEDGRQARPIAWAQVLGHTEVVELFLAAGGDAVTLEEEEAFKSPTGHHRVEIKPFLQF